MEKIEFKKFCDNEFKRHGFKKVKKSYYLNGQNGVLCLIELQKSNYGPIYYVNFYFFLGQFNDAKDFPPYYDLDVQGRILVMSKTMTDRGEYFLTSMIEYEKYIEEELRPYFDKEFAERILPPIYQGKKYILNNLGKGKLYSLTLRQEEVMQKLQS